MTSYHPILLLLLLSFTFSLSSASSSSSSSLDPEPPKFQPFQIPKPSTISTIPAIPSQSNIAGCPLNLHEELFHDVKSACGASHDKTHIYRSRCCPVLATWLYSAYSATALGGANRVSPVNESYDLPLLPDDSETCLDSLEKGLKNKGVELVRPNETCDLVYCYCGIRLHPLSCNEAFYVNEKGNLVGDGNVKRLERNCLTRSHYVDGFPALGGCSKCLNSLYQLNSNKTSNTTKSVDRTTKMQSKDCQLMGLTWLLAKNRTAYIQTVLKVFRAIMMSPDGSNPLSCTLISDGMPLAVDSSEISGSSSSRIVFYYYYIVEFSILFIVINVSSRFLY